MLAKGGRRHDVFNVGLLIPTSGSLGLLGPSAYACAMLACDAWNANGGHNGREVRLTVVDSSEVSKTLDTDVRELLDDETLDAALALCNTDTCRQISQIIDRRAPLIYTPHFEGCGLPGWVHSIGETPERQLRPAIDWMHRRFSPKRWFLLGNDYSWPRQSHRIAKASIHARGSIVVAEHYVPLGDRNFEPIIEKILASRADAVLISLIGAESIYMCRKFADAGLSRNVLRLSVCMEENSILGMGADNTEGMYVAAGYFANLQSECNDDFKERYNSKFGDRAPMLNSLSQSVYEGIVHLQKQCNQARTTNKSPSGLRGVRATRRGAYDPNVDPVYMGAVEGLSINVVETLDRGPQ